MKFKEEHYEDDDELILAMKELTQRRVLETKTKSNRNLYLVEEDTGILFVQDEKGDLCSFKSIRIVHEVNRHKGKDQLIAAYRNAEWMSPELANTVDRVVKDCKVLPKNLKNQSHNPE